MSNDLYKKYKKNIKHGLQNNLSKDPSIGHIYIILNDNSYPCIVSQLAKKIDVKIRSKWLNWCKKEIVTRLI